MLGTLKSKQMPKIIGNPIVINFILDFALDNSSVLSY